MALIVETGAGSATAETYAALATINAYATKRGLTFAITGDDQVLAEGAARRSFTWLNGTYRSRFTGRRTNGRAQAGEFPRIDCHDNQCPPEYLATDEIPQEIIDAQCEAAIREKASPGALSPDVVVGKIKKSVAVSGAVSVEYAVGTGGVQDQRPVATVIDDILASLLGPRPSRFFGSAVRG